MINTSDLPRVAQFEHKPSGTLLMDHVEVGHTLQCAHCARHFLSVRGSGHIRGFCVRCRKITCGDSACGRCVPWEKRLEMLEAAERYGRPPVEQIIVPVSWTARKQYGG